MWAQRVKNKGHIGWEDRVVMRVRQKLEVKDWGNGLDQNILHAGNKVSNK